jgi:ABC-type phosphate transport system substrate-binding protein
VTLAFVLLGVGHAQAAPVAVVVHPNVEVDDLSFTEFRKIILAERQFWSAGKRITLIVRAPEADERTVLLERVYKMSEAEYRQYWVAKVFRAEVTSGPRVVLSNEEAVDLVSVIEGAVAVVSADDVPEGLKVLKIDGRLPGESGYPFN